MVQAQAGPHEEVTVGCTLGVPTRLATDQPSVGRQHRPLTGGQRATRKMVAVSRDRLMATQERNRKWRIIQETRTTTTEPVVEVEDPSLGDSYIESYDYPEYEEEE